MTEDAHIPPRAQRRGRFGDRLSGVFKQPTRRVQSIRAEVGKSHFLKLQAHGSSSVCTEECG